MGKAGAIIGAVFSIVAVVAMIGYFVVTNNINQEHLQQANQDYKNAVDNMDSIVNQAVAHCEQHPDEQQACNTIMKQWYDQCQTDTMKDVPSCHDGRIVAYLKANGLM